MGESETGVGPEVSGLPPVFSARGGAQPGAMSRNVNRDDGGSGPDAVLVVGAGPTGLTLAAQLHAHGARVRVVERRVNGRPSRAFVVHPRTLEMLAPLGVSAELVSRGNPSGQATIHAGGRETAVSMAGPDVGECAYPYLLAIPQEVVEEVLTAHLTRAGVPVERGVEFMSLSQGASGVNGILRGPDDATRPVVASYVVGCDGASSTVRRQAGVPFWERSYRSAVLLADVIIEGGLTPGTVHGFVGGDGILFFFPWPSAGSWRLLVVDTAGGERPLTIDQLQLAADRFTAGSVRLCDVGWAERVALRRGQARVYRADRVILAGDAAHVHSPAGAQGMNTGIQDACNLGWKLAMVASGRAAGTLLDSYQTERWPVARLVRWLTDLVFLAEAGNVPMLALARDHVAPLVLPLIRGRTMPVCAFSLLGGLWINHRDTAWVADGRSPPGRALHAGDRLLDGRIIMSGRTRWLHDVLRPPGWHLLVCGADNTEAATAQRMEWAVPLAVHRLARAESDGALADPDGRLLRRLGGGTPAVYLVRPDGYIGYRAQGFDFGAAARYLAERVVGTATRQTETVFGHSLRNES